MQAVQDERGYLMVIFQTEYQKLYNYIIHNFLLIEVFNEDTDLGDIIEELLPKYLYREQYRKCVKAFEELFHWTADRFYHEMSAFHEIILFEFINYMSELQEDIPNFKNIYFDEECHKLISEAVQRDYEEDNIEQTPEECRESYYNVFFYTDSLFIDTDFTFLDLIYNNRKLGNNFIEETLGINIDYYFEVLPLDIQEQFKTEHITLSGEVSALLRYIEHRMVDGNLYKLFWEHDEPIKEERIHLVLENIMDAYFYNQDIEITREAVLGDGKIDFKIYKNSQEDEKVLVEVKRASSIYLKKGYEKQLTSYMRTSNYKNAFYLVACFTEDDYEKTVRFIHENVYTDTIQLYINIAILDLRKRKVPSLL